MAGSAQDPGGLAGISRRSTRIAVVLPGSGRDQQGSPRDHLDLAGTSRRSTRIAVILPGSGRDQQGSRRDELSIEVILPGQVGISWDHGEISSGSR